MAASTTEGRPLAGLVAGVTADRRWEEQAELLRRRGATVQHGAALRTLPLGADAALRAATEAVVDSPPDVVVLSTGLGVRAWLEAAEAMGLGDALTAAVSEAEVVARGPKAAGAAVTAGWPVHWRAPSATAVEMVAHLAERGLDGARVAAQLDGRGEPVLADDLAALGADVVAVPVYRWERPVDPAPVLRLVEAAAEARIDALTFTSSPAVWNVRDLAAEAGVLDELRTAMSGPVLALCVGPVCSAAAAEAGFARRIEPAKPRLGSMVQSWVAAVRAEPGDLVLDGVSIALAASTVVVDGVVVELAPRERDLLGELLRRPGAVVSKDLLLRSVWRNEADTHAVEVAMGRLRRRLAPVLDVVTVPRRGYRVVRSQP